MKTYLGARGEWGPMVMVRENGDDPAGLPSRRDLRNHSPTGFEWGYEGSGPAQLALAILADVTHDDEYAQEVYQDFKRTVVANLPAEGWTLTAADVMRWLVGMKSSSERG